MHSVLKSQTTVPYSSPSESPHKEVTGTILPDNKQGLDVNLPLHDPYIDMVMLALVGYQPEPTYNEVTRVEVSTTRVDYEFKIDGSPQFSVRITNTNTAFPTVTVVALLGLLLENNDGLLLESGDALLKEGA